MIDYKTWGGEDIDEPSHKQMRDACALPVTVAAALMADAHLGYGVPIGSVVAMDNAVSPGRGHWLPNGDVRLRSWASSPVQWGRPPTWCLAWATRTAFAPLPTGPVVRCPVPKPRRLLTTSGSGYGCSRKKI